MDLVSDTLVLAHTDAQLPLGLCGLGQRGCVAGAPRPVPVELGSGSLDCERRLVFIFGGRH
jgi:hypothetical protein